MDVILIGLDHRTAPLKLRDRLSLTGDGPRIALKTFNKLKSSYPNLLEGAIISTCNRFEIYASVTEAKTGFEALKEFFPIMYGFPYEEIDGVCYQKSGEQVYSHLFRVAAGLESMVLGEPQILGQVVEAESKARQVGTLGPILSRLFMTAIQAGKQARTETEINQHTTSISHAAVGLVKQQLHEIANTAVLILGAGDMAEQAAFALQAHQVRDIRIISRTHANAKELADTVSGKTFSWQDLPEQLTEVDVVITATAAPHVILRVPNIMQALSSRKDKLITIVDIALPRNVDEAVKELGGVALFDLDDLQLIVDDNHAQRLASVPFVEEIIAAHVSQFLFWLASRDVLPTLKELRQKIKTLVEQELENGLNDQIFDDVIDQETVWCVQGRVR